MQQLQIKREEVRQQQWKSFQQCCSSFPAVQSDEKVESNVGTMTVYRQQGVQLSQVNLLAVQDALEDQ